MSDDSLFAQAAQYFNRKQFAAAYKLFAQVVQTEPANAAAWLGWGAAALESKKYRQARIALERAFELTPHDPAVLSNLAGIERTYGELDKAWEHAEQACKYGADKPVFHINLALLAVERGEVDKAIALLERLVQQYPGNVDARYHLAHTLFNAKDTEAAERHFQYARGLAPHDTALYQAWIGLLFRKREYAQALEQIETRLQRNRGDQYSLALKAMALKSLGKHDLADPWIDPKRWIRAYPMNAAPDGFEGLAAWNQAIFTHISQHPNLAEIHGQATKNGERVEEALQEPMGPVRALGAWVLAQLQDYLQWMGSQAHPYQGTQLLAQSMRLRGWAVLMYSGGFETPHLHPGGLLSCVYYAAIPDVITQSGNDAGHIGFGQPDPFFEVAYELDLVSHQPQEGLLLVFPSYLWHHTIPFMSEQKRLSLAFDLELI